MLINTTNLPTAIYAVIEPLTGCVRYVGKTIEPLQSRLDGHLWSSSENRTHAQRWFAKWRRIGIRPAIMLLEEVPPSGDWAAAEKKWIRIYRESGCRLVNATSGGEGMPGYRFTEEQRKRRSDSAIASFSAGRRVARRGELNGNRKLTEQQVVLIVADVRGGAALSVVAQKYRITSAAISQIMLGQRWTHLTGITEQPRRRATPAIAREIVEACIVDSQKSVAGRYGIKPSTVSRICAGDSLGQETVVQRQRLHLFQAIKVLGRMNSCNGRRAADSIGRVVSMLADVG